IGAFGEELPNVENRIELASDKDEFGMPLAKIIHSFDQDAVALWNANFEEGLTIAKATGAKEVWSARGNMPTIHLMGGTISGHERGRFGYQQLRPDSRDSQPLRRGAGHLYDRRCVEPDLHDPGAVAARRRAVGGALGYGGRVKPQDGQRRLRRCPHESAS